MLVATGLKLKQIIDLFTMEGDVKISLAYLIDTLACISHVHIPRSFLGYWIVYHKFSMWSNFVI